MVRCGSFVEHAHVCGFPCLGCAPRVLKTHASMNAMTAKRLVRGDRYAGCVCMWRLLGVEGFSSGAIMMAVNCHVLNAFGPVVEFNNDDLLATSLRAHRLPKFNRRSLCG